MTKLLRIIPIIAMLLFTAAATLSCTANSADLFAYTKNEAALLTGNLDCGGFICSVILERIPTALPDGTDADKFTFTVTSPDTVAGLALIIGANGSRTVSLEASEVQIPLPEASLRDIAALTKVFTLTADDVAAMESLADGGLKRTRMTCRTDGGAFDIIVDEAGALCEVCTGDVKFSVTNPGLNQQPER